MRRQDEDIKPETLIQELQGNGIDIRRYQQPFFWDAQLEFRTEHLGRLICELALTLKGWKSINCFATLPLYEGKELTSSELEEIAEADANETMQESIPTSPNFSREALLHSALQTMPGVDPPGTIACYPNFTPASDVLNLQIYDRMARRHPGRPLRRTSVFKGILLERFDGDRSNYRVGQIHPPMSLRIWLGDVMGQLLEWFGPDKRPQSLLPLRHR